MSQAQPVPIRRMVAIRIKGGTNVPGEMHYLKYVKLRKKFIIQQMPLPIIIVVRKRK